MSNNKEFSNSFWIGLTAILSSVGIYIHQLYTYEQAQSSSLFWSIVSHIIGIIFTGFLAVIGTIGVYAGVYLIVAGIYFGLTKDRLEKDSDFNPLAWHPVIVIGATICVCVGLYRFFGNELFGVI